MLVATRPSTPKTTAASGAVPYVATSETWLADSRSSPTRLGTDASFAGIQNRLSSSTRIVASSSQVSVPTSGIETNRAQRSRSVTTMRPRRSKRSASTPAIGPSSTAGSSRKASTPPTARLCAPKPLTIWVAKAVTARKPSQSPKLDSSRAR